MKNLWRKHKRAKTEDKKEFIEKQIIEISKKITPIAEEIKLCDNIFKRLEKIKEFETHQKLEKEKEDIEKQINKKIKSKER